MTFFYNLNKTLDAIREKPETTHGQLNERDMGKHNNKTTGFKAVADKAAKEYGSKAAGERVAGAQFQKMKKAGKLEEELDEGFVDAVKSGAQAALGAIGSTMGHGSDEDMIKDLQKKAGLPVTGKVPPQQPGQQNPTTAGQQPVAEGEEEDKILAAKIRKMLPAYHKRMEPEDAYQEVAEYLGIPLERLYDVLEVNEGVDKKAFAALAEPRDKITFADKIAGAKKEVDEMLGDVAAEAMKNALSGGQKKLDKNKNGKLDATDFEMLRKGGKQVADEGFPTVAGARDEMRKRKVGDVTHGAKHDTQEIPGGRRVTRRTDPNTGYSVGSDTDDEGNAKSAEKRGRGRPKKADRAPERVTAKATKHKGGRKTVEEGDNESDKIKQAMAMLKKAGYEVTKGKHQGMGERKLSSSEKSEREDIVKGMKKNKAGFEKDYGKDAKSVMYATATKMAKERGPGNPDRKKKEKAEESSTTSKGTGGMTFGKGIYDSINRELEDMISESMNVNVSMNVDEHGEPRKSITVSAEGEAAEQLAQLLNLAGMQAQDSGCGCETSPCSCGSEELDENQPDWPTNTEIGGENDPLMHMYAGGLNRPKSTGQTTGAPYNSQPQRQGAMAESQDIGMKLYAELKSFKG